MPWRDQRSVQCPLCEAAFRASSKSLLRRILEEHVAAAHGTAQHEALRTVDPLG